MSENERELRQIAAQMYKMLDAADCDIGVCLNPSKEDESCPGICEDCGWYKVEIRDRLLRLGVEI